jgi:hypothetical protein
MVAGRDFTWTDTYAKTPVAIVSENMAREYWGDPANALGKRIRVATVDDWREVVGVAGDVHDDGVNQDAPTSTYWPIMMSRFEGQPIAVRRNVAYAIRSPRAGSEAFLTEVRQAVWSVNGSLPLSDVYTVEHYYKMSMARTSFTLVMLGVAGGMALAAWGGRHLRRDRVLGFTAAQGNRHSHGARRATAKRQRHVCPARTVVDRGGSRVRTGYRNRGDALHVIGAVQGKSS